MSDDWDVIEELEFWDDYNEFYGPQKPTNKQIRKMNKAKKRKEKEMARKRKEAEDRIAKKVADNINAQNNKTSNTNDGAAEGCAYLVIIVIIIIAVIWFWV